MESLIPCRAKECLSHRLKHYNLSLTIEFPGSASPDLRSNKKTPGFGGVQHQTSTETPTKGRAKVVEEPIFDDDYIEMDPVYTEPPLEEESEDSDGNTDTLKAERSKIIYMQQ